MRRPPLARPASLVVAGLALLLSTQQRPAAARPLSEVLSAPAPAVRPARAPTGWIDDLDALVEGHGVSVAIGVDGAWLYRHSSRWRRPPASNEKLLLSMAILERSAADTTIRTRLFSTGSRSGRRLRGTLWIVGEGDPEADALTMRGLAAAVRDAGIRRLVGRVVGVTTGFRRDWWATGWRDYFPEDYVALPTALTFEGNEDASGRHVTDPERRAAVSLTKRLRALGVRVTGDPDSGHPPERFRHLATVTSAPLTGLLRRMNRASRNFHAEVLGKWLGERVFGGRGTIAKGARAIERFAEAHGAEVTAHDGSGLSYRNRVRPLDLVELLWYADTQPWGDELRRSLAAGGQGTLEDRLRDVRVRAKTGTLERISALSGWVWLERAGTWAEFSILSQGMPKSQASEIEDRIVRIVANHARI